MLCVAQNHRLQAHRHCCLTWIFCVKWNMRDLSMHVGGRLVGVRFCLTVRSFEDAQRKLFQRKIDEQGKKWFGKRAKTTYFGINLVIRTIQYDKEG